jgi:predicted Zn finger-like uncharacterized protein
MAEIVNCPQCDRKLRVPDDLLGKKVKCPTCGQMFTAEAAEPAIPVAPDPEPEPEPEARSPLGPPPGVARPRANQNDYEDQPRRRPLARPRRERVDTQPHRGSLILVLGILGIVACQIFGPVAWLMANNDLAEMRSGRMDPEGEGLTNAGRVCGIIGTVFLGLNLCCGMAMFVLMIIGALAGDH